MTPIRPKGASFSNLKTMKPSPAINKVQVTAGALWRQKLESGCGVSMAGRVISFPSDDFSGHSAALLPKNWYVSPLKNGCLAAAPRVKIAPKVVNWRKKSAKTGMFSDISSANRDFHGAWRQNLGE